MATEKYIVAARQWNLGFIKGETVRRGNVIVVDRERNMMTIDGREFKDIRDIDIAKRQAVANPDNPLIVAFSEKALAVLKQPIAQAVPTTKKPTRTLMEVVQSDEDTHETIDISDTQISKKTAAAKEAERRRVKGGKLEVIRGDETPAEVQARVRAALNRNPEQIRAEIYEQKLPVVKDDSLGADSSAMPLNAGQKLPNLKTAKANEARAKAEAAARKKLSESVRSVDGAEVEMDEQALPPTQEEAEAALTEGTSAAESPSEVELLRGEVASRFAEVDQKFDAIMSAIGKIGSSPAPAEVPAEVSDSDGIKRVPVRAKRAGKRGGRK